MRAESVPWEIGSPYLSKQRIFESGMASSMICWSPFASCGVSSPLFGIEKLLQSRRNDECGCRHGIPFLGCGDPVECFSEEFMELGVLRVEREEELCRRTPLYAGHPHLAGGVVVLEAPSALVDEVQRDGLG